MKKNHQTVVCLPPCLISEKSPQCYPFLLSLPFPLPWIWLISLWTFALGSQGAMPLSLSHAPAMLIFLKNGPNQGALSCTKHQKNAKGFLRLPAHSSQGSHEAPNPFPNFILSSFHLPAPTCVATRDTQPPPPPTPLSDISQFSGPLLLSSCSMDHPHPPHSHFLGSNPVCPSKAT